jgi:antitoxin (DNA-binding transcriptional repressor) of toxin-antitoxin stability system
MYIVHMKRVTASEARRNWFRLLDEVAAGTTVVIERGGRRIVLKREPEAEAAERTPDYGQVIRVPEAGDAHEWGWRWEGEEGELVPNPARPDEGA